MLAVNRYEPDYIDACEARLDEQLAAWDALAAAAKAPAARAALDAFAPHYFNDLVVVLEGFFVHRTRALEGKDGNALNEVRLLCAALQRGGARFAVDRTIRYEAARAVLKLAPGDAIALDAAAFRALCAAFFAELRRRYR